MTAVTPLSSLFRNVRALLVVALLTGAAGMAQAATKASGTISNVDLGGGVFRYTITLTNVGTTAVKTLWFAWVPGQDYLATSPTNIVSPAGWSAIITGGAPGDGYAIQWTTSSAPLAPGASLDYSFESTDTPTMIAGNSVFFPSTPVGTSFVYEGAPFSGGSSEFVVGVPVSPSAPAAELKGAKSVTTTKSKITVRGTAAGLLSSVSYRIGSHKTKPVIGTTKWHFTAALKKGRNVITIVATGPGGASKPVKLTVTRK
jgi:hypothetical protein